ncbi:MAG: hypothetical protein ACR2LI_01445 [Propionibacteriaceae bacterium]
MHWIVITQIRLGALGQAYYREKNAEACRTPTPCARIVYGDLQIDQQTTEPLLQAAA